MNSEQVSVAITGLIRRLLPLRTDKTKTLHYLRALAPDVSLDDLQTETWQLVHEGTAILECTISKKINLTMTGDNTEKTPSVYYNFLNLIFDPMLTNQTAAFKTKKIQLLFRLIADHQSFLILSHAKPDGDAIGSQIAFAQTLKNLGKKVRALNEDGISERFTFLKGAKLVKTTPHHKRGCPPKTLPYDVCIILDTAIFPRIGPRTMEWVKVGPPCVNIDHHVSNPSYARSLNLVHGEAAATGEILFHLITLMEKHFKRKLFDPTIDEALYTAISTDTGSFQYNNTNANCHLIAAELISRGLQPGKIATALYSSNPLRRVLLLKNMLQTLEFHVDNTIASMVITCHIRKKLELQDEDTTGLIQTIREIATVKVAIVFDAVSKTETRVSFRSKSNLVDVNKLASLFSGGGHIQAAGATLKLPLAEAQTKVIAESKRWLKTQPN